MQCNYTLRYENKWLKRNGPSSTETTPLFRNSPRIEAQRWFYSCIVGGTNSRQSDLVVGNFSEIGREFRRRGGGVDESDKLDAQVGASRSPSSNLWPNGYSTRNASHLCARIFNLWTALMIRNSDMAINVFLHMWCFYRTLCGIKGDASWPFRIPNTAHTHKSTLSHTHIRTKKTQA